jgi:hypothetical protein
MSSGSIEPPFVRRFLEQNGRHALVFGEAEQSIADAGESGHQTGTLDAKGCPTPPAAGFDGGQERRRQALEIPLTLWSAADPARFPQKLQMTQVAVTERVIAPKTLADCRVERRPDLGANRGVVCFEERPEAPEPYP